LITLDNYIILYGSTPEYKDVNVVVTNGVINNLFIALGIDSDPVPEDEILRYSHAAYTGAVDTDQSLGFGDVVFDYIISEMRPRVDETHHSVDCVLGEDVVFDSGGTILAQHGSIVLPISNGISKGETINYRSGVFPRIESHQGSLIDKLANNCAFGRGFACDQYRLAIEVDMLIISTRRNQNGITTNSTINPPLNGGGITRDVDDGCLCV